MGETNPDGWIWKTAAETFSILERIDVGETSVPLAQFKSHGAFSILERIDVGETGGRYTAASGAARRLSVSSNGSTWVKRGSPRGLPLGAGAFSILERIDVGETRGGGVCVAPWRAFSILERIDVGETCPGVPVLPPRCRLSVSSNGSTWVKRSTTRSATVSSPLSVSSNGSTWVKLSLRPCTSGTRTTFSILERIDVGETRRRGCASWSAVGLSVSSNGSTWVKPTSPGGSLWMPSNFQYPRTDRRG